MVALTSRFALAGELRLCLRPQRVLPPRATAVPSRSLFSCCSSSSFSSNLQPPDVARLAETARISLSPEQVEAFGPKIRQVVDWFGQLRAVDLESFEPALRAETEPGTSSLEDLPETFENKDALIKAVPHYEEPYIKVPKVLAVE